MRSLVACRFTVGWQTRLFTFITFWLQGNSTTTPVADAMGVVEVGNDTWVPGPWLTKAS